MAEYCKEGWTIEMLIKEIEWEFRLIMNGESWKKPFKTKQDVQDWVADRLPNHKGAVKKITNYFVNNYSLCK